MAEIYEWELLMYDVISVNAYSGSDLSQFIINDIDHKLSFGGTKDELGRETDPRNLFDVINNRIVVDAPMYATEIKVTCRLKEPINEYANLSLWINGVKYYIGERVHRNERDRYWLDLCARNIPLEAGDFIEAYIFNSSDNSEVNIKNCVLSLGGYYTHKSYKEPEPEEELDDVYKMDLHEELSIHSNLSVIRVPNGWIYHTWYYSPNENEWVPNSVFVPEKIPV